VVFAALAAVAAGVVFYVLLAIFPTISTFVSLYAFFADPATIREHLAVAAGVMPPDAFDLLQGEVMRIASKPPFTLGLPSLFSLLFALWSANAGTKAMFDALNVAYDETEKRGFIVLNIVSLAFTAGAILFLLLAVSAVIVVANPFRVYSLPDWVMSLSHSRSGTLRLMSSRTRTGAY
jgi:membrane protein